MNVKFVLSACVVEVSQGRMWENRVQKVVDVMEWRVREGEIIPGVVFCTIFF